MSQKPDALLRRRAISEALVAAGFPVRPATLATMASRGGGPPYRRFGRIPLYHLSEALAWAESRLSPPRGSSSEIDASSAQPRCRLRRHKTHQAGTVAP
jgi:hypothetical protein